MPIDFSKLPETVSRKEFCSLTGIPPRTVARMVAEGTLRVFRPAAGMRARYLRVEIARLMRPVYEGTRQSPRTPPAPAVTS